MAPAAFEPQKKKTMDSNKRILSELKTLGQQLLSSRAHINNLPLLLGYISSSSSPQYALESLLSLQSFFTTVLPDLPPLSSKGSSAASGDDASVTADSKLIYQTWVRAKFDEFTKSLIDIAICKESDETLREVVLDAIMELVKIDNKGEFYTGLYHKLLQSIINSPLEVEFLVELLASKYLNYIDVRYFTYISIKQIAKSFKAARTAVPNNVDEESQSNSSEEVSISKMHFILSCIPPQVTSDEEVDFETWCDHEFLSKGVKKKNSKAGGTVDKLSNLDNSNQNGIVLSRVLGRMKLKYSKAWMTFLSLPLPLDLYKEVLVILPDAVIPFMSNPVMLCDFLTKSCDIGGVICVMALSSLFILMTRHGLEYPNFYEKLYALLVPSIFMAKYRAKFFELLDTCLKSPLLPAYLAAAFTKKLSRLALVVPPSGGLIIIALIHNLLRRHPSINCLVHQEDSDESTRGACTENKQGIDHFKYEEGDPLKSNALRSSLWEMDSLRHHYCPHVSRFVLSLENDLTVRSKVTEMLIRDFSSGSYSTIFREEIRRRVKQVPLAYYKTTPTSLFAGSDFPGWSFENEKNTEEEKSIEGEEANSVKRRRLGKSH